MRVIVKFHESARDDYDAWVARLRSAPTGNAEVARIHAEELVKQLRATDGMPAGAVFRDDLDPASWVWRFSADTWVRYVLKDIRVGMFGGLTVEVVVTAVATRPPA